MAWGNASYLEVVASDLLCLFSSHSLFYKLICGEIEVQDRCAFIAVNHSLLLFGHAYGLILEVPCRCLCMQQCARRELALFLKYTSQYASNILLQAGALFYYDCSRVPVLDITQFGLFVFGLPVLTFYLGMLMTCLSTSL